MADSDIDRGKRRFLIATTGVMGGIGGAVAIAPFAMSMSPSARARAAGAPVEVDISKIEPGMMITVEWRQTGMDRSPHAGNAGFFAKSRYRTSGSSVGRADAAQLRQKRSPVHQARLSGTRGHLYALGLFTIPKARCGGCQRFGKRLAGRIFLSLSWFQV